MATNNFKPFSTGSNANVIPQADYEALDALINGFQAGKASSAQINKALRQSTFVAAALAQFLVNKNGTDVLDNGDLNGFVTLLGNAFAKTYLSRSNPFADIKADGTAAIIAALANLGLDTALAGKAALTGSTNQKFWVLSAPGDNNAAVPVSLLNSGLNQKADLNGDSNQTFYVQTNEGATAAVNNTRLGNVLGGFAYRGGDASQGFAVAGGTNANSAIAYGQFQSGTNGNGAWTKLPGGGQWCRQNLNLAANATTTWTFPAGFVAAPAVFITAINGAFQCWLNGIGANNCGIYNNGAALNVNLLAVW
ncbi:hypothetical protein [Pantoea vagans]|uniref:hypothetical protein n=1 Tax=Pantoea vagans TaxID=470934 RepID=UPI0039647851